MTAHDTDEGRCYLDELGAAARLLYIQGEVV
jgi:hypothetical protein